MHSENVSIRIEMYHDRMEAVNNGSLYGTISIDVLGKVHPETQNAVLVNILELLKTTENCYSGIPAMRAELKEFTGKSRTPYNDYSVFSELNINELNNLPNLPNFYSLPPIQYIINDLHYHPCASIMQAVSAK